MKTIIPLKDHWLMKEDSEAEQNWLSCSMPSVVQEVLLEHGLMDAEVLETGRAEKCAWVSERDWLFKREFDAPCSRGKTYLEFKALDTVADIYVNGQLLHHHDSMYMPCSVDITAVLQEKNTLLLRFFAPVHVIDQYHLPPEYEGKISPQALLRKTHMDFGPHGGVIPYFTPIGVYGDINLIAVDECEITYADIETDLDRHWEDGTLSVQIHRSAAENVTAVLRLFSPDGDLILESECSQWKNDEQGSPVCHFELPVEKPKLWWPRNYGGQPLYRLEAALMKNGRELDHITRTVGFRKIELIGDMRFRVNGREVKLWGVATTPMWGLTHKWMPDRIRQIMDFSVRAHANAIRLWGPGQQYDEALYEYACENGILVWQEFHTWGTYVPDVPEYTEKVMQEAEIEIRRLKHYPCILLWCGGNEHYYMLDIFVKQEKKAIGFELMEYRLRDLVARMDPRRYYHASCPCLGRFPNSALHGDTHGSRAALSFLPGEKHARFFSENIRTFTPEIKSLRRFIPEDEIWPEGYTNLMPYGGTAYPIPETWKKRTINHFEKKTGPYELFYDATDAESLVYRLNAAAAYDFREIITKLRQGKPFYDSMGDRQCTGYLFWKLCCPWPQIYCALIDYYLEPGQVYYMMRRCYAPVSISIDLEDHIYIWGVNDTADGFAGTAAVEVCDLDTNRITARFSFPVGIPSGDSLVLKSLDCLGHITLRSAIHCTLSDAGNNVISEDFQYLVSERRLPFGECALSIHQEKDALVLRSEGFARCVELNGDDHGDAFGWKFEDNYFDMMPGQERKIHVFGRHKTGRITAKAHYSAQAASADWRIPDLDQDPD